MIKSYFYNRSEDKISYDIDLNEKAQYLTNPHDLLWIDIYECTSEDLAVLARTFEFHPLAIEDCLQESPRAKVDRYEDYYFFVFHALRYNEESDEEITTAELDVFLGPNYLITIHKEALPGVARLVKQCWYSTSLMQRGPDYVLYNIVDGIVDEYFPILERIGVRIDELEDEIYTNPVRQITEEFLALKRTILLLRKVIIPQKRIFANVNGRYSFRIMDDNKPYYMDLVDHIEGIIDATDTYRDLVNGAMDTYYSIISNRTNDVVRVLTIISTVILPPTLITSFFGMNVKLPFGMGESGWAVWGITAFMVALTGVMFGYFYRNDWM